MTEEKKLLFQPISKRDMEMVGWYLLLEIKEAIFIFVEVGEHVEALSFADVVDHVVVQELVDVVGGDLA